MARVTTARLDGPTGWIAAAAGCLINAWSFGVFYSFGLALDLMSEEFGASNASTAGVFAVTTFGFFCLGVIAGPLADRFGARPLIVLGSVFIGGGLILTSQVNSVGMAYLTYGVGVGTGIGLYLVPITIAVGGWFDRRRASALGVATAGIGIGTLALVPAAEYVIRTEGWRDAFRWMGIGSIIVFLLAAAAMARPPASAAPPGGGRAHVRAIIRTAPFRRMYAGGVLMSIGLFTTFAFVVTYAKDEGIAPERAATLISVLGVGSVLGRLGIGPIAARFGVMAPLVLSFGVQPFAYVFWLTSGGSFAALATFTGLLGVGYGGYVALSPVAGAEVFGMAGLGGVLGLLYTSAGVGGLIGPIALGAVIDRAGFTTAIVLSMGLAGMATSAMLPLWLGEPTPRRRRPLTSPEPLVFALTAIAEDPQAEPNPAAAASPLPALVGSR